MPGNMTKGYDLVIEVSLNRVADSLKAILEEQKGSEIGDAINGALNWAIKDFNYVCAIDAFSFRIPDSIAGQVEHKSLYDENAYLKLSFNENYSVLKQAVPIKITLEMVIGVDIGAVVPGFQQVQSAQLDLKNLFGYYRTTISLNDSQFAGTIRDICNLLYISADELLQMVVDQLLRVAGIPHDQLDNKFKRALQDKVPYIPIPITPIVIMDTKSTNPLFLVEADCRALETTTDKEQVLVYLFTYGGGTEGNRWAFDNFPKSDIKPGNDAAIIVSFKPYTCRIIKGALTTALNLTGTESATFSQSFRDCKLWRPVVIDADENVTLTSLSVQILPPGFTVPGVMTLTDGAFLATATITKSGTCYSATGSLTALIKLRHDGNNNVVIDTPIVNVNVDAGVDTWCQVAAAALGFVIFPEPVITAIVEALVYEILDSIFDSISRNAISGVTGALTAALSTMTDNMPQIPVIDTMLKMVAVDDVTMGYTFHVVRKAKLPAVMMLSPVEGARLTAPAGSKCTTTLRWAAVSGASGYLVEVLYGYPGPNGTMIWRNAYKNVVQGTQLTFDFAGTNPGLWRVTALDKTGKYWQSNPGWWHAFSWVPSLQAPALVSPAEGQHLSAPVGSKCTMTLQWQAVSGARGYLVEVQYGNPGLDGEMIWSGACRNTVTGTQLTFDFAGANPGRWRVTALDGTGWYGQSAPSAWRSFSWAPVLPAPVLLSPANKAHLDPTNGKHTTVLKWQAVAGATGYFVEVQYGNPGRNKRTIWSSACYSEMAGTTFTFDFVGANPGRWRVTALDRTGRYWQSAPSAWRTFEYTV